MSMTLLLLLVLCSTVDTCVGASIRRVNPHQSHGYKVGDPLHMECQQPNGTWADPPPCAETGRPFQFRYGKDHFQHCGFLLGTQTDYDWIVSLVQQSASWRCRVKMTPEHDFYVPFDIPLWGVVEPDHVHVDNHLNFIFHAFEGKILGMSAYSVRDRFVYARPGTVLTLHGAVKWFKGHTFTSLSSSAFLEQSSPGGGGGVGLVLLWCIVSVAASLVAAMLVYRTWLRPRIIRKYQKKD